MSLNNTPSSERVHIALFGRRNVGKSSVINAITNQHLSIVSEFEDVAISGKLNAKYLLEDYAQLEEYSEQDVFILCKVVGLMQKESVEIFDPLKDFIRLPRAVRRQTNFEDTTGLEKIYVEGPVLKVEIIAIYK